MDWHLGFALTGVLMMFVFGGLGVSGKTWVGLAGIFLGLALVLVSLMTIPAPHIDRAIRADRARATIAAATAAVATGTAESKLAALERAASVAATAAASKGER